MLATKQSLQHSIDYEIKYKTDDTENKTKDET